MVSRYSGLAQVKFTPPSAFPIVIWCPQDPPISGTWVGERGVLDARNGAHFVENVLLERHDAVLRDVRIPESHIPLERLPEGCIFQGWWIPR